MHVLCTFAVCVLVNVVCATSDVHGVHHTQLLHDMSARRILVEPHSEDELYDVMKPFHASPSMSPSRSLLHQDSTRRQYSPSHVHHHPSKRVTAVLFTSPWCGLSCTTAKDTFKEVAELIASKKLVGMILLVVADVRNVGGAAVVAQKFKVHCFPKIIFFSEQQRTMGDHRLLEGTSTQPVMDNLLSKYLPRLGHSVWMVENKDYYNTSTRLLDMLLKEYQSSQHNNHHSKDEL